VRRCVVALGAGEGCDPREIENVCAAPATCEGPAGAEVCTPRCGNGHVESFEQCDDGNQAAGDNCSPACDAAGDTCAAPYRLDLAMVPGVHRTVWRADVGTFLHDDYTGSCGPGTGPDAVASFTAPSAGRYTFATPREVLWLWDGACGPTAPDLACSLGTFESAYQAEASVVLAAGQTVYAVTDLESTASGAEISVAREVCGDGHLDAPEVCDDGNTVDGDNCSSGCDVTRGETCAAPYELGWDPTRASGAAARWTSRLAGFPSAAAGSCGGASSPEGVARFVAPAAGTYSFRLGGEYILQSLYLRAACDDPATELGCVATPGRLGGPVFVARTMVAGETVWVRADGALWTLAEFDLSVDPVVCGDGVQVAPEECDDGNLVSGDGCAASCLAEHFEAEPNENAATATALAPGLLYRGSLASGADRDTFGFEAVAGTTYRIETFAGTPGYCFLATAPNPDFRITLSYPSGGALLNSSQGPGSCPYMDFVAPTAGRYYVTLQTQYSTSATVDPYFLRLLVR
jgi:cysteine-rich repeat protein